MICFLISTFSITISAMLSMITICMVISNQLDNAEFKLKFLKTRAILVIISKPQKLLHWLVTIRSRDFMPLALIAIRFVSAKKVLTLFSNGVLEVTFSSLVVLPTFFEVSMKPFYFVLDLIASDACAFLP